MIYQLLNALAPSYFPDIDDADVIMSVRASDGTFDEMVRVICGAITMATGFMYYDLTKR